MGGRIYILVRGAAHQNNNCVCARPMCAYLLASRRWAAGQPGQPGGLRLQHGDSPQPGCAAGTRPRPPAEPLPSLCALLTGPGRGKYAGARGCSNSRRCCCVHGAAAAAAAARRRRVGQWRGAATHSTAAGFSQWHSCRGPSCRCCCCCCCCWAASGACEQRAQCSWRRLPPGGAAHRGRRAGFPARTLGAQPGAAGGRGCCGPWRWCRAGWARVL